MNIYLDPEKETLCRGNTFAEESDLLKDFFNDPYVDVETYITEHCDETPG